MTEEEFRAVHPWPKESGVKSLFRFMSINPDDPTYVEKLFIERKLYHSLAKDFNDPFEGKPHFILDGKVNNAKEIRKHLMRIVRRENNFSFKKADAVVTKAMAKPNFLADSMKESSRKLFDKMRICCFTTSKDNLLFWSHYANSHKGFCIEFDAEALPISMAFKMEYSDQYPIHEYPMPDDARAFKIALRKSSEWQYENEYRTIFTPLAKADPRLPHDGESLILKPQTIKNIYLGAQMSEASRIVLLEIIEKSDFSPSIWQASLSESSFSLIFNKIK